MVDAASDVDEVRGAVFDAVSVPGASVNVLAVPPRLDGADWAAAADTLISVVTNRLHSDVSRRGYRTALRQFLAWHCSQTQEFGGQLSLSRALVQRYQGVEEYLSRDWR